MVLRSSRAAAKYITDTDIPFVDNNFIQRSDTHGTRYFSTQRAYPTAAVSHTRRDYPVHLLHHGDVHRADCADTYQSLPLYRYMHCCADARWRGICNLPT